MLEMVLSEGTKNKVGTWLINPGIYKYNLKQ